MSATVSAKAVTPRSSPKGERRRLEILTAAAEVFSRGGYDSASIEDIAQRVGISRAGLLHHFPSKPALLHAVLDNREVFDDQPWPTDGVRRLIRFITVLRRHELDSAEMTFFAMLSTESAAPDHPAHDYFLHRYQAMVPDLAENLGDVFDTQRLPSSISIEDLARMLAGMADGIRIQWLFEPHVVKRSENVAQFLELMMPHMFDTAREEFRTLLAAWRSESPS